MSVISSPAFDTAPNVTGILGDAARHWQEQPLDGGLVVHTIGAPGRALNLTAQWRIYDALVPVTTQAFGADMTPYWSQRSKEGYLERITDFALVSAPDGTMIGWTGSHILPYDDHTAIYLDSTGMVPGWQSRGIMRSLMRERLRQAVVPACPDDRPVFLTARTESPIFYRLMRSLLSPAATLFPRHDRPTPHDVRSVARHLATWLGQSELLEADGLAIRGAYGGTLVELYGEMPTTGDPDLDTLFQDELGLLDAYLLVGRLR